MRILVLCYEYPPIGGGGGNVARSLAEQLVARGHAVRVQTAGLGWRDRHETIGQVDVRRTASGRRAPDTCSVPEMAAFVATSFLPTLRTIRAWQPDVIHAHFAMPTGLLAWAVHRLTGIPYVLTAHLGDVPGGVPAQTDRLFRIAGGLARRVWAGAASATAVSSFVQELAERAYGRSVERILNGIDLTDLSSEDPVPHSAPRLVFVGRFNAQKNPIFLVDALASLDAGTPWKMTFIGDGPLRTAAEDRCRERGLADRVTFTGWLEPAAVQAALRDSDILCLPSTSEGLPVAAIESLKHGLAIAASDIPGVRDVVVDGVNGWRVPLDAGPPAYARQLERLLLDRELLQEMRQASRRKVRAFDLQEVVHRYERVLQGAAGRPNHAPPAPPAD